MILKNTIFGVCLLSVMGLSSATDLERGPVYFGAHAQIRHTNFDKNFGKTIMRKDHHQGHVFAGFRLSDDFSIEIGRESMVSKPKQTILVEGQVFNGVQIPGKLSPSMFCTNMKLKSTNVDFLYFNKISNDLNLFFVPSIGVSYVTVEIERETLKAGTFSQKIPTRFFKKSFLALKPSAALQYDFNNGFSIRTSASFINRDLCNGSKMKTRDHLLFNTKNKPRVNLKDSLVFGVGFLMNM